MRTAFQLAHIGYDPYNTVDDALRSEVIGHAWGSGFSLGESVRFMQLNNVPPATELIALAHEDMDAEFNRDMEREQSAEVAAEDEFQDMWEREVALRTSA